ncbi:MAG: YcaO-like family protein [Pseudomonadota bacterium]
MPSPTGVTEAGFWHGASLSALVAARATVTLPTRFFQGTHRGTDPETTLARLQPDLHAFGITRVARLTGLDRLGIEVFTAFRPNSRGLSMAQGKGATAAAARVSAIMEAVECHVAETPSLDLVHGTLQDVVGTHGPQRVAPPQCEDGRRRRIDWTQATDFVSGDDVLVPFDRVHANLLLRGRAKRLWRDVSTDGLASGGNIVEALIHGLCEVIERVDTAAFAGRFSAENALDPNVYGWPELMALGDRVRSQGCAITAWETTGPLGVPSFIACIADLTDGTAPPGYGAGCHLSPRVALARAVHEAAQSRLTRISGARDDLVDDHFGPRERLRARHFATAAGAGAPQRVERPDLSSGCLVRDLWALTDRLAAIGAGRVLAVDLADDPRFRVVRVIVPGLAAALDRARERTQPAAEEAWRHTGGGARLPEAAAR